MSELRISGAFLKQARTSAEAPGIAGVPDGFSVVQYAAEGSAVPSSTAALAWESRPPTASHHLVVGAHSRVSPLLIDRAREAASLFPHSAISFFAGWDEPNGSVVRLAAAAGYSWVEGIQVDYASTAAILLPSGHASWFASFIRAAGHTQPDYDAAFLDFLQLANVKLYLSVPSFVDIDRRAAWYQTSMRPSNSSTLSGIAFCPYFHRGLAYSMNRYGTDDNHTWCHEHWSVAARRSQLDPSTILGALESYLDKTEHDNLWLREDYTFVPSLWVTAYLVGAFAKGTAVPWDGETTPVDIPDVDSPLLDSLLDGGLNDSILEKEALAGRERHLKTLARAGYIAGSRAPRTVEPAMPDTRTRGL